MSSTQDFIDFVCDQIGRRWKVRYRKMFGEYMIYIKEKPLLLVCDNIVYVKKLDCLSTLLDTSGTGFPYHGAKEHYIIDVEDNDTLFLVIQELEKAVPLPAGKTRKTNR